MQRKPEWMIMYQELVKRHHVNSRDQYHPYEIRILDTCNENECIEWCIEHVKMDAWTWGFQSKNPLDVDFTIFTFLEKEDAVLFRLTWS